MIIPAILAALISQATPLMPDNRTPIVAWDTTSAVIAHESGGNPTYIHDNTTNQSFKFTDPQEAAAAARKLVALGDNLDCGLMQINTVNFNHLHLTFDSAFLPEASIRAGTQLMYENYQGCLSNEGQGAVDCMLSLYNTGSKTRGLVNGYVAAVRKQAVPSLTQGPAQPAPQAQPVLVDALVFHRMGD